MNLFLCYVLKELIIYHKLIDDQFHEYVNKNKVNKRIVISLKTYTYLNFHGDRQGLVGWTVSVGGERMEKKRDLPQFQGLFFSV